MEDLISRKALLDTLQNHFGQDLAYLGEDLQYCQEAVQFAPSVDAEPKWISVKERLPEDQRSVLTVNGHGEIRIMGLWSKRGDEWTWVHNDRMMHYNDITHWMPLPEPPKEDDAWMT